MKKAVALILLSQCGTNTLRHNHLATGRMILSGKFESLPARFLCLEFLLCWVAEVGQPRQFLGYDPEKGVVARVLLFY